MTLFYDIDEIKTANKNIGHHFFDQNTMRGFKSRISDPVIGNMFVSSECGPDNIRRYTVREANERGAINTVGQHGAYKSKQEALREIKRIVDKKWAETRKAQGWD